MRGLVIGLSFLICAASMAQTYRFGWRDEVVTARNAENLNASAMTEMGELIVAGTIQLPGNKVDVIVRKYGPLGEKVWERIFDFFGLTDTVQGVVLEPKGDIYISASTPKNGFGNFCIAKLSGSDGKVAFQKVHDSGVNRATPYDFVLDSSSQTLIQVGGYGRNAREEFMIVKWSLTGDALWTKTWRNPDVGDRAAHAASVAQNGDIVVAGYAAVDKLGQDSAVVRFSPSGDLRWAKTFPGGTYPSNDRARCVATDSAGDVLVGGDEYVSGSRNFGYVAKLAAASGDILWKYHLSDPKGMDGQAVKLNVLTDGVIAAMKMNPTNADGFDLGVLKISPAGKELWRAVVNGGTGFADDSIGLTSDSYGSHYVFGTSSERRVEKFMVACIDSLGKVSWSHRDAASVVSGPPSAISVSSWTGNVSLVGTVNRGVDDDLCVTTVFQAPRASDDRYTVHEGETLLVSDKSGVLSNDIFHALCSFFMGTQPKSGQLAPVGRGGFTYKPQAGFLGEDSFTYELKRDGLSTSPARVTISVVKKPKQPE